MEIAPSPITFCSKEHQKIYREWFDIADSGSSSSLKRGVLLGISLNFNIIDYFVYRWRWPYHWKRCYKVLSSFKTFSARTQAGFNFRTLLLLNLFFFLILLVLGYFIFLRSYQYFKIYDCSEIFCYCLSDFLFFL